MAQLIFSISCLFYLKRTNFLSFPLSLSLSLSLSHPPTRRHARLAPRPLTVSRAASTAAAGTAPARTSVTRTARHKYDIRPWCFWHNGRHNFRKKTSLLLALWGLLSKITLLPFSNDIIFAVMEMPLWKRLMLKHTIAHFKIIDTDVFTCSCLFFY